MTEKGVVYYEDLYPAARRTKLSPKDARRRRDQLDKEEHEGNPTLASHFPRRGALQGIKGSQVTEDDEDEGGGAIRLGPQQRTVLFQVLRGKSMFLGGGAGERDVEDVGHD